MLGIKKVRKPTCLIFLLSCITFHIIYLNQITEYKPIFKVKHDVLQKTSSKVILTGRFCDFFLLFQFPTFFTF